MELNNFTIYKVFGHPPTYEVYLEQKDQLLLDKFSFVGTTDKISDYPTIARLEGTSEFNYASRDWLTYYNGIMDKDYHLYEKGTFEIVKQEDKFMQVILNGEMKNVTGEWIIRKGRDNRVLLWKPMNDSFSCPCKENIIPVETSQEVHDSFAMQVKYEQNTFKGTMVASGVYSGMEGKQYLFTDALINKLYKKYYTQPENILVDVNHDDVDVGHLTRVRMMEAPVNRLFVEGIVRDSPPDVYALSIAGKFNLQWSDQFNILVVSDIDIKRVSLLNQAPGCKICYLE